VKWQEQEHKMPVPVVYRKSPSDQNVSVSFQELTSGIGYSLLYPATMQDFATSSGGILVTSTSLPSNFTTINHAITETTLTQVFDIDFDNLINKPIRVKGNTTVGVPITAAGSSAGTQCFAVAEVRLRKWNGTTETEIAAASSAIITWTQSSNTSNQDKIAVVNLVTPLTKFNKGEYLRLTVRGWCNKSSGSGGTFSMGFDPMNRASTNSQFASTDSTRLTLALPIILAV
jgi:hypothetical protein